MLKVLLGVTGNEQVTKNNEAKMQEERGIRRGEPGAWERASQEHLPFLEALAGRLRGCTARGMAWGAGKRQGEPHSSSKRKGEPHAGRFSQVQSLELDLSDNRLPVLWGLPEISTCRGSLKEDSITQALKLFLWVFIYDVLHSIHNNQVYEDIRRYEWTPRDTTGSRHRPTKAKNKGVIRHRIEKTPLFLICSRVKKSKKFLRILETKQNKKNTQKL